MSKMRLIREAAAEIKERDPDTAITFYSLRRLVKSGTIPSVTVGNRILVNMEVLERYLNNEPTPKLYGTGGIS